MKRIDLKTIWQVPKYLPYLQPSLTDAMVKEAEIKIGYQLPKEYIELLKIQNGGYIRFTIIDTLHSQISGIGPYFPSITDYEWLKGYQEALSFELDGLFPFDGDGHWNICLDYRNNKIEPEITYIDTESNYVKPIAKSFKEYLNLLEIETENNYVIETVSTIENVLNKISGIVNIEFEGPDYFAHGYPIYRSKYNESWVWVSPNKVPSAFIRESDDRYEEMKSQMETTSLRYPEILADYLFISVADDKVRENLFEKLTNNSFKIPLKELI